MGKSRHGVSEFELTNLAGCRVRFLDLGGIVTAIEVPDRHGTIANVALGYDDISDYFGDTAYHGAIVGRYANRIAGGQFELDGVKHRLSTNDGHNTLHGGVHGFNAAIWTVELFQESDESHAVLRLSSGDGDEGFPGTLDVTTEYTLTARNTFRVTFEATTSKPTHVNLSHHTYFNLCGQSRSSIVQHELTLHASRFTVVDRELIPTGELRSVEGTAFDFRKARRVGDRIDSHDPQLEIGSGYDHNFVIDRADNHTLVHAASLLDRSSGRMIEIHTTAPGIQVYSGNHLERHPKRSGIALETQHYPDSPNHPEFPSTVLRPGEKYRSQTEFRFTAA